MLRQRNLCNVLQNFEVVEELCLTWSCNILDCTSLKSLCDVVFHYQNCLVASSILNRASVLGRDMMGCL
jgi:hypothetical protein